MRVLLLLFLMGTAQGAWAGELSCNEIAAPAERVVFVIKHKIDPTRFFAEKKGLKLWTGTQFAKVVYRNPFVTRIAHFFMNKIVLPPEQLLQTLEFGLRYTFVLLDDELLIAPPGREDDRLGFYLTKHPVMARAEPVYFPGEMWIDSDGALVLMNDSGGYLPPASILEPARRFFTELLGSDHVRIQRYDP